MRKDPMGLLLAAAVCAALLAVPAAAQDTQAPAPSSSQQEMSVAEAARLARQQKKTEPPAKQVWTNENIPQVPREEAVAEKGAEAGAEGEAAPGGEAAKGAKPLSAEDEAKKLAQLEAQWRQKFIDAQKKLDDDQKDLELMERELGLKRQQYFSDPNQAMRDQYQRDSGVGGEVNNLVVKIDQQKQKIEADRQAIDDLQDGLRKAGLPAGWSRNP